MPSDYESFGMVALEAMSCGTPVIASHVGGLQFLVRDQETGFLVPAREPIPLADAIKRLVEDPARLKAMGRTASRIAKDYAWSKIANRIVSVFEEVAGKRKKET